LKIPVTSSPQRFETRGVTEKYQSQFWPRQNDSRHFHLSFEGAPLDKTPYTLWIPHVGADTIAYINNARSASGETRTNILLGTVYLGPTERIAKQIKRSAILSHLLPLVAYVAALFALTLNLLATLTSKAVLKHGGLSLGQSERF